MAGIAASEQRVAEVLAEIDGYVVAANKNCPTQTVIAGETDAVEAAMEAFRSRGITVYPLPVSHAFHSRIVAPASAPLRKVLERLDIQPPRRPVTTNVTSNWYPSGPDAREEVLDILAQQVAAPVEWIAQMERMYADGARVFVECGPKRALSGFVATTFKTRPHRALYTNHPKRGGVASFRDALAALVALGLPVHAEPVATDIFGESAPRRANSAALAARATRHSMVVTEPGAPLEASGEVANQVRALVARISGYTAEELSLDDEFEADLGIDTVKQAELVARMRDHFQLEHDPEFRLSEMRTIRDLARYAAGRLGTSRPAALPALPSVMPMARPRVTTPVAPVAVMPTGALSSDALSALMAGAVRAGVGQSDAETMSRMVLPAVQGLVSTLVQAMLDQRPPAPAPAPLAPPRCGWRSRRRWWL